MMFTLTRVIQSLLLPPAIFLILMAVGFLIRKDCRVLGRLLVASGFLLLYAASISPVTGALIKPLEAAYPPYADTASKAEAIVVLGGGVRDLSWLSLAPEASDTAVARVAKGVSLNRVSHIPLVMVGGNGNPGKAEASEADAMARTAAGLGVPKGEIIIVGKTRNTLESALAVRSVLRGSRIILVTSAVHMVRAAGMFRKKGFTVNPAPCGYRGDGGARTFYSFIPRAENLYYSSGALSEYISMAWYRIRGDL